MKLSDIKGERVLDVIADLIEPITNIAADDEATRLFKREACPDGKDPKQFMAERIKSSLPKLMKGHKDDLIAIMSTIEGVPEKEYRKNMTMASVINGLVELMNDKDFLAFLA